MAFLKEDSAYTHVIAIDFGTGASGYLLILTYLASVLLQGLLNQDKNTGLKSSILAMNQMIRRQPLQFSLMTMVTL